MTADKHCCARLLLDNTECNVPSHEGVSCDECIPYIHSDGTIEHEPKCTQADVVKLENSYD